MTMAPGKRQSSGTMLATLVIIILLVAVLLAVTNPDRDTHMQAISDNLSNRDAVTNVINLGILTVNPPEYRNYAIFSITTHNSKTASVGIFSFVWVNEKIFK